MVSVYTEKKGHHIEEQPYHHVRNIREVQHYIYWAPFYKLTIDGNYHGNLDFDWLLSPVTMVVAIDGKVTITVSFRQQAQFFIMFVLQG